MTTIIPLSFFYKAGKIIWFQCIFNSDTTIRKKVEYDGVSSENIQFPFTG
jgi:hypothetical protein